ncbi:MAG: YdiU family protein [Bacillaceae bacterium]|nr:YdiU family protein [Bacillaceae bacterium]
MKIENHGWKIENSYTQLPDLFYSSLSPTPVTSPELVIFNKPLATALGLNSESLQGDAGLQILGGNRIPEGAHPLAQAYAGHQFGHFTMLGDGRAILLGEQITPYQERFDIQLKGPGRTPYSRRGDGRAALGPMLREYIISEAMHALGIATTRSLAVVETGEPVYRETEQPGAILTRVASSHIRVGTFEYAAKFGSVEDLRALADYTIKRHFPSKNNEVDPYVFLLTEVVKRQAKLISQWQLVGFIHGVMNTDNMTISGETIDYGPCAFMDTYDPETVFSSIDRYGRYAYGNQPKIAAWNLARFAESLLPLIDDNQERAVEKAQDAISSFPILYRSHWLAGMRAKLGIFNEEKEDEQLVESLLKLMQTYDADYTNTFVALTFGKLEKKELVNSEEFKSWYERWRTRLDRQKESQSEVLQLMKSSNPAVIPRNHRVEEALEAAVEQRDYLVMKKLLHVLSDPYAHTAEQEEYAALPLPSACKYRTFCGT